MAIRFSERTQKIVLADGNTTIFYWRDPVVGYSYMVRRVGMWDSPAFCTRNRKQAVNAIAEKCRMYGGRSS